MKPAQLRPARPAMHPLHRAVCIALLAFGGLNSVAPLTAYAQETQAARRIFAIPAGSLDDALGAFGTAANIMLAADPALTAGIRSPGLSGEYSVEEGLARLLAGTPLHAVRQDARTWLLLQRPVAQEARDKTLPAMTVTAEVDRDIQSHEKVYTENLTTAYQDREQLQRFNITNPGDVFKGMNGVYSMDSRSSQSITPNIRGITGEGRTPLTIDGTEQSTNVWLHFYGAGNRSYADPAMFRSVEVEKGPSLTRGIKSGVGGAVNIRTIDAKDIIPEGENIGIELKLATAGNTSRPRRDANSIFGKDYHDIPDATLTGGTYVALPLQTPRTKGDASILNFDDHAEMFTIAARNDFADVLLSHSERSAGNYYAGKKNAGRYSGHDAYDQTTTDSYVPNLTKMYKAGNEIYNTANDTQTTLFKNNWYLPNDQKIALQFMRTKSTFGETTPGSSVLNYLYREAAELQKPDEDWSKVQAVEEYPHSNLKVNSYKLSYDLKPEGSDWLNLEASLWQTKTRGTRYQTGANAYTLSLDEDTENALNLYNAICGPGKMDCVSFGWLPPAHDGTIVATGKQWTSHDRSGFDLSNQMRLADNLHLTLGGSYQREKLDERLTMVEKQPNPFAPSGADQLMATDRLGPRAGKRKEWSAMMNLAWQPTSWLTLTAGTRYLHYTGKDTGTAKRRRQQEEFFAASRRLAGLELKYREIMAPEDKATLTQLQQDFNNAWNAAFVAQNPADFKTWEFIYHGGSSDTNHIIDYFPTENAQVRTAAQRYADFLSANNANHFSNDRNETLLDSNEFDRTLFAMFRHGVAGLDVNPMYDSPWENETYWNKKATLPYKDGKFDSSHNPFANGEADMNEAVDNPYGTGTVNKYRIGGHNEGGYGEEVYQRLDTGKTWEMPEEESGHAFSPVFSATARITPFGTAFLRYAQTTRFPSVNELTSSAIIDGAGTVGGLAVDGASKPERSTNWEIGYAHDLRQFFPTLNHADVRVSYFNTEIRDFMDRSLNLGVLQLDKKKSSGIELQSRFDTSRFYGGLGATYRLKQKTCDKDIASAMDPFYNRVPTCMTGGFPGSYSGTSLQPKYSIDMNLGARLYNNQLEFGWRGVYHSGAENDQLDKLLGNGDGNPDIGKFLLHEVWFRGNKEAFYWKPVMLHDIYATLRINKELTLNLGITNLTDRYYLDPMSKVLLPGPGRTLRAEMRVKF
ncbi:TonB-dependent receptor domain-containing protein [Thauera sp. Sel9]|uniref:TonB-dependent receptor domain-containing protein n=1 Tax=Thauera sp. Sel9 TaxID=2974299 RepID=UPI0021E189F0|nr:TonB-dependent receptor [Thauera sp. Sel9]MCV2218511.1 TonB-dependent receptor [Thauera sp. Sel9]